jgi:hypothetical protein
MAQYFLNPALKCAEALREFKLTNALGIEYGYYVYVHRDFRGDSIGLGLAPIDVEPMLRQANIFAASIDFLLAGFTRGQLREPGRRGLRRSEFTFQLAEILQQLIAMLFQIGERGSMGMDDSGYSRCACRVGSPSIRRAFQVRSWKGRSRFTCAREGTP